MEDGGSRIEDGGWRIEDGGWRIEDGGSQPITVPSILNPQSSIFVFPLRSSPFLVLA